jgi:hypothetical protein
MQPAKSNSRFPVFIAVLATLLAALTLAVPLFVIRPFRPQGAHEFAFALAVRNWSPYISGACLLLILLVLFRARKRAGIGARSLLLAATLVTLAVSMGTHVNIFEQMFHPYIGPVFASAAESPIAPTDKLLSVTIAGETHAFPIRTMGYHHIVNDTLANIPIAATYCTLCHTGILYDRRLNGRTLYFNLAGINNGNALLRDRETGSIWQQSTGEAVFGPLKGQRLTVIPSDELTFALWQKERPNGLILRPDAAYAALYDPADWETHIARTHVVVDTSATGIEPHTLMLGLTLDGESKAFPIDSILTAHVVEDHIAGRPVMLVHGPDGTSIRAFDPRLPGSPQTLHFAYASDGSVLMSERETGSSWGFDGCAAAGPMTGKCLPQLEAHKTYWFDWFHHHPDTHVFHG